VAELNNQNGAPSFIVECFEEFYQQVLRQKHFVLSKPWKKGEGEAASSPNAVAEAILTKLETCLQTQAQTAAYGGNAFAQSHYEEAQYIMAALADEVFLNLKWPGKTYWESNLLEQRLFDTHSAGQTFFIKLDLLLENWEPTQMDAALLFLNALALGFQGKYRHFNDVAVLKSYRDRLFVFVNRRDPYLFQETIRLFPETYVHTLEGLGAKQLPSMNRLGYIFAGLGVLYLLASYIIWYNATEGVSRIVDHIISHSDAGGQQVDNG